MKVVPVTLILAIVASAVLLLRSPHIPAAPVPVTGISPPPTITRAVMASGVTIQPRQSSRRVVRRTVDDHDRDAAMVLMFLLSAQSGSQTR